jgi:DHA1 family bicyclomycin/chloramphenicol resistance-like MFS transporter
VFLQFFGGAVFSQLYGLVADGTPGPMMIIAVLAASFSLVAGVVPKLLAARRRPT